jgi:hypothetical protein
MNPEGTSETGMTPDGQKKTVGLENQIKQWPTPRTITGGAESAQRKKELGRIEAGGGDFQAAVLMISTGSPFAPQDHQIPDGQPSSITRRTLNPLFVEWLMGWPMNWTLADPRNAFECPLPISMWLQLFAGELTDCAPAETACSLWLQLMRGELLTLCSPLAEANKTQMDMF